MIVPYVCKNVQQSVPNIGIVSSIAFKIAANLPSIFHYPCKGFYIQASFYKSLFQFNVFLK